VWGGTASGPQGVTRMRRFPFSFIAHRSRNRALALRPEAREHHHSSSEEPLPHPLAAHNNVARRLINAGLISSERSLPPPRDVRIRPTATLLGRPTHGQSSTPCALTAACNAATVASRYCASMQRCRFDGERPPQMPATERGRGHDVCEHQKGGGKVRRGQNVSAVFRPQYPAIPATCILLIYMTSVANSTQLSYRDYMTCPRLLHI